MNGIHEVVNLLRRYAFPGDVRELENAIEHASVMGGDDRGLHHRASAAPD
jgi:transcriptional regulator with PAS, ATPase and Fis domain